MAMSEIAEPKDVKRADPQHPVHELIRARWSPRAFAGTPVPPDVLRSILEAARWAPSSFNEQPWRFIVATKGDEEAYEKLLHCFNEKNRTWARLAPVLMISVAKRHFSKNEKPNRHAWHDVGHAVANLTLQALVHGVYVHQMAGILPDVIRETYAIPEEFEPVAGLALGYLGDPEDLPEERQASEFARRSRRSLEEMVFSGSWGEAPSLLLD